MVAVPDLPPEPTLAPVDPTLGEPGILPPEHRPGRQLLRTLGLGVIAIAIIFAIAFAIVIATLPPIVPR